MSWWVGVPYSGSPPLAAFQAPSNWNQALAVAAQDQITISHDTPFATEAAAEAWIGRQEGGSGGSGGSGSGQGGGSAPWWVEYIPDKTQPEGYRFVFVEQPSAPAVGGDIRLVTGPFASKAAAQASVAPVNVQKKLTGGLNTGGLAAIGEFFSRLGQASTWIRVAEVLLGLGLIIVGLAKLASGTAAGKAALKAGKAAAIL